MSSKMKVIQRMLPEKLNTSKKLTKVVGNPRKLSLKEQYLYHIAQELKDPSKVSNMSPSYKYEISKKSRKQLVRDVQYLEKLAPKSSVIESPQLAKVVKHLPYIITYNNEQSHNNSTHEISTSSRREKHSHKFGEEIFDDEPYDGIDKDDIDGEKLDEFEYNWEYYDTHHDPLDDELFMLNEKDARAVEEIRNWRLSFE